MTIIDPAILSASASIVIFTSTFPQTLQTIRTNKTRDNNFLNLIACVAGLGLWTSYAAVTFQPIFVIGDGVDMGLWAIVLFYKTRNIYKREDSWR